MVNNHVGSACRRWLPRDHWSANSIKMHLPPQKTMLICNECTTKGYTARDTNLYDCAECAQKLGNARFDSQDLYNKRKTGRHKNVLICGCDANSCSTMTR